MVRNLTFMNTNGRSWIDHPLHAAAVTMVSTVTVLVLIYKEVLLPTQLATSTYRIESLEREVKAAQTERDSYIAALNKEKESHAVTDVALTREIAQVAEKYDALKADHKNLQTDYAQLQLGSLFSNGSPYPSAYKAIAVGDPIDKVQQLYGEKSIEKSDAYWATKIEHPYFGSATYYFTEEEKPSIYQILYMARYDANVQPGFFQDQLTRAFGDPTTIADEHFFWGIPPTLSVFKSDRDAFIVARKDIIPGGWHRPIDRWNKTIAEQKRKKDSSDPRIPAER